MRIPGVCSPSLDTKRSVRLATRLSGAGAGAFSEERDKPMMISNTAAVAAARATFFGFTRNRGIFVGREGRTARLSDMGSDAAEGRIGSGSLTGAGVGTEEAAG